MTTRVIQTTGHFWWQKLQEQIAIIHRKHKSEPLERIFALDIALAYLFLYLFLEATTDQVMWNILYRRVDSEARQRYSNRGRYLRDKLEFIFSEFCSQLSFKEFATLKRKTQALVNIRNRIVHLEELSWTVLWKDDQKPKEKPTESTEYLTVRSLGQHYSEVRDFLASLATTLNRGFEDAKIDIEYKEGDRSETRTRNFVELIFQMSVPPLKDFEDIT